MSQDTAGHHAPAAIRTRDLWLRSSAKKVGATEGPTLARNPDAGTHELLAEVYAKKPAPAPRYSDAGPAVQLEPCDACALIGELVEVLVPNPRPLTRRRIGEPEMLTVHVHAKTCQSERRLKAAARYVLGGEGPMTDVKIPISVNAEQLQQLELEVREVHGRAQRAELEREQALRQLEQLTRDNVKLMGHVEDLRASRDQVLSTLETISRGYHSGNYAQLITAMGEALATLSKFKRSGR